MISVVILCAGSSTRMNQGKNKVLLPLNNKPIFMHSLEKFLDFSSDVVVVSNEENFDEIKSFHPNVVLGGRSRQESVYNGIKACKNDIVLVHDGARPFVSKEDINKLIESKSRLAFLGSYLVDSIKDLEFNNLNRDGIILTYTPQLVTKDDYINAYANITSEVFTDDVSLVSHYLGIKPELVIGKRDNIKITTDEDYINALNLVSQTRIGHSWDIHKLVEGRKLILGGIEIPFEKGLLGHSDADALLHAISESLLGALALGDLGAHFPDNDPKYKGIDSKEILKECLRLIKDKGYVIGNIDSMIYAEKPKMAPHILPMRKLISELLEINIEQISIKATTHEKMGVIGKEEAIACESVVLLKKYI